MGGNSEGSGLATSSRAISKELYAPAKGLHAPIKRHFAPAKGQLPSLVRAMAVVPFMFLATFALSSCSSDGEEEKEVSPSTDYKALLTAHEWEIASAGQRIGGFFVDVKEADAFCRVTADSIYFSQGEETNYFDGEGHIKTRYEITPCGSYAYSMKGEEIKISDQTFNINSATDSTLVLMNEGWKLVLKNKR